MPIRERPPFDFETDLADRDGAGRTEITDAIEHVRKGTRRQFESDWVEMREPLISGDTTTTRTIKHGLSEIPWYIDIIQSDESSGRLSRELQTDSYLTFTKDETDIVLTRTYNGSQNARTLYFRVRAM